MDETSWQAVQSLLDRPVPPGEVELAPVRKLLDFYERFAEKNRDDLALRLETSKARLRAGDLYQLLGKSDQAEQEIRAGVALAEALVSAT